MRWIYRPIDTWPGTLLADKERVCTRFKASFATTLKDLEYELVELGASEAVIQLALDLKDVRRDGLPRAGAKPAHPGVIVSFESTHGPLRYLTDAFKSCYWNDGEGWHANLRAIALGLTDLRRLDRYGISRRGEAYTGWAQLPPGRPMAAGGKMTVEEAARYIARHAWPGDDIDEQEALDDPETAYRLAAKRLHPDAGGDPEAFRRLGEARAIVEAHR